MSYSSIFSFTIQANASGYLIQHIMLDNQPLPNQDKYHHIIKHKTCCDPSSGSTLNFQLERFSIKLVRINSTKVTVLSKLDGS